MRNVSLIAALLAISFLILDTSAVAGEDSQLLGEVTYVSSEGIYINAGSEAGLALGDSLRVRRNGTDIATVVVNNISSRSAAAVIVRGTDRIQAGDSVYGAGLKGREYSDRTSEPAVEHRSDGSQRRTADTRIRGDISISSLVHRDMTDADRSWSRPGLASRLWIDNLGAGGMRFEIRHRSRLYHRSRASYEGQDTDEWSHQVYEFGLFHDGEDVESEWGVGRVIAPYVRGVGFIDGAYYARSLNAHYKIGFAAGTSPSRENSGIDLNRRKLGGFVAYESGSHTATKLTFSAAFSTEYEKNTVSRDFVYLQGTLAQRGRFSMYHSIEIDLNRDWRYEASGDRFTLSNYLAHAALVVHRTTQLFFSYDNRRNIRYFETRNTPDSLFDETTNQGVRGGARLRFSDRVSVRVSGGVRFRDDDFDDPVTAAFSIRLSRFPDRRQSVSMFVTYVRTEFTTGYRPMVIYQFPAARRLLVSLTGAGHFYETGVTSTKNYYGDIATSYYFASGLYASGSVRQYFDDDLQSTDLFIEAGWRW